MKNNETLKQEQKQEAIARMKMLGIFKPTIKEFEEKDVVNVSEGGILYWLNDSQKAIVSAFEEKHEAIVYHVIHNFTEFGELYSLLYVSKHKSEWKLDREDIKSGIVLAYVKNMDDDWCSEFGSIAVKNRFGGLIRVS